MLRNPLYILEILNKNIGNTKSYEFVSTSPEPLIKISKEKEKNKNKYLQYEFSIIKINHNNNKNKLDLLNKSKVFKTEALLNICFSNNNSTPLFSYNDSYKDYYANNESNLIFFGSDTFLTIEEVENKKIILNERQNKHLEMYGWVDTYNT